jgi:hypothetical protein
MMMMIMIIMRYGCGGGLGDGETRKFLCVVLGCEYALEQAFKAVDAVNPALHEVQVLQL